MGDYNSRIFGSLRNGLRTLFAYDYDQPETFFPFLSNNVQSCRKSLTAETIDLSSKNDSTNFIIVLQGKFERRRCLSFIPAQRLNLATSATRNVDKVKKRLKRK